MIFSFPSTILFGQEKPSSNVEDKASISMSLGVTERGKTEIALSVTLRNDGSLPIYVAYDPVQPDGTKGYYLSQVDDGTLLVGSRVFAPIDGVYELSDRTSVQLKRLAPLEEFEFSISLCEPLTETLPPALPALSPPFTFKKIDLVSVRKILVNEGYFVEDQSMVEMLARKKNLRINGLATPLSGPNQHKKAYEIQKMTSATIILGKPSN